MKLAGKVALITGAGSGIGKASAMMLAQEGAKVGVLSRTENQIRQVVDEIEQAGGEALALLADVSDPTQMQAAIDRLVQEYGRLDIVFANAGINGYVALVPDMPVEEYDRTMDINLKGTFLTVKYSVPYLRKQGGGSIIIDSSVNGNRMFSNIGFSVYAATKAGQAAFAKMWAMELGKDRIRVNVICPGAITTEIGDNTHFSQPGLRKPVIYPEGCIPLTGGKPGKSEQVAKLVLFLASDDSDHISGTEIYIDGAESLIEG